MKNFRIILTNKNFEDLYYKYNDILRSISKSFRIFSWDYNTPYDFFEKERKKDFTDPCCLFISMHGDIEEHLTKNNVLWVDNHESCEEVLNILLKLIAEKKFNKLWSSQMIYDVITNKIKNR